jgi:predicted XRE-type DNA-binding protein
MSNNDFSSLDNVSLSASDIDLISKLTESNHDSEDRAALHVALTMLVKQRNMLAYRVSELINIASAVQSELAWKATNLQSQLDQANASVELQYRASLVKDKQADHFVAADSL